MAENETTEATMARAPAPSKPTSNYDHPPYAEMIFSAIKTMNERNGSSRKAIAKFIDAAYSNLPPSHAALLTVHLRRMKLKGQLLMVKHSYKLPKQAGVVKNPNSVVVTDPAKRGRGRPPKPKSSGAPGVAMPRKGRGRPPKPKVLGVPGVATPRRGRGRPPKPLAVIVKPVDKIGLLKRPRGRPRKVDGGAGISVTPKKRGRPSSKEVKVEGGDGATLSKRPRGRPKKVEGVSLSVGKKGTGRPVGRPKKISA